ncbi:hypothetical protein [Petropleomorpha daqingensis]|uniref:Uncharacterized protein n=1 Tax=Petropleomorpha daqingensis TaxID=2026353 RepID=A0A853CMV2_9ACTN|nr:hypothetical protein [Petropleomorpha daqingensis]NYJ07832.1 hypothetical protein [Petropleomorpha daqingensis]
MARRRIERSESFTESVADPTEPDGAREIPNLAAQERITDADGVVWRRRGRDFVDEKRLRKLLRDPAVRVVHDYLGEVADVPPDDRTAFWERALDLMARSAHSDFVAAEFTNESHAHLLVVHEYC